MANVLEYPYRKIFFLGSAERLSMVVEMVLICSDPWNILHDHINALFACCASSPTISRTDYTTRKFGEIYIRRTASSNSRVTFVPPIKETDCRCRNMVLAADCAAPLRQYILSFWQAACHGRKIWRQHLHNHWLWSQWCHCALVNIDEVDTGFWSVRPHHIEYIHNNFNGRIENKTSSFGFGESTIDILPRNSNLMRDVFEISRYYSLRRSIYSELTIPNRLDLNLRDEASSPANLDTGPNDRWISH